jgi:hypothetical protein
MYQLPEMMSQASHSAVTAWIWGLSIILQLTLFIALFNRGIARDAPLFTNFVGFYLLRSVLLYVMFDDISVEEYGSMYNFLLLLDVLVQIGLAAELARKLVTDQGSWTSNRILYIVSGLLIASLGTWLAVRLTPQASIRLDRSQLFFSIIAILLFIASFRSSSYLLRTIAQGWGLFSIINFAADIGRVFAAASEHPRHYAAWSYALAGAYLIVVVFWLVTLRAPAKRAAPTHLKVPD